MFSQLGWAFRATSKALFTVAVGNTEALPTGNPVSGEKIEYFLLATKNLPSTYADTHHIFFCPPVFYVPNILTL